MTPRACACGLVKAVISAKALEDKDVSWANAPLAVWASAEQSIGILCACIPVVAGAVKSIRKRSHGSSNAYKVGSGGSHGTPRATNKSTFDNPKTRGFGKSVGRDSIDELTRPNQSFSRNVGERRGTEDLEMQPPRKHAEWM